MTAHWQQIALMILLLLGVPAGFALILRAALGSSIRSSAAVVGGVMAGVLLGPTVFGRAAPGMYESVFIGGGEERRAVEQLDSRHGADLAASEHAGADDRYIDELQRDYNVQRAALEQAWRDARWEHQQPVRLFVGGVLALVLAGSALFAVPRRRLSGVAHSLVSPVSIGLWSALLPGAIAYFTAQRWWGWSPQEAMLTAAAVMMGPWALRRVDRGAADAAEQGGARTVQTAGRIATLLAIMVAAWGMARSGSGVRLLWILPLLAIIAGWLLSDFARAWSFRRARLVISAVVAWVLVPALAAMAVLRVDVFQHVSLWPLLVLLILSGDGRWLGALLGTLLLGGRGTMRSMRLVLGSMACGPTQLAVAALASHLWLIPEEATFGLVAGAMLVELSAPMRRSMAERLNDMEAH